MSDVRVEDVAFVEVVTYENDRCPRIGYSKDTVKVLGHFVEIETFDPQPRGAYATLTRQLRVIDSSLSPVEAAQVVCELEKTTAVPRGSIGQTIIWLGNVNVGEDDHYAIARRFLQTLTPTERVYLSGGHLCDADASLWKGPKSEWLVMLSNVAHVTADWVWGLLVHAESCSHIVAKHRKDYETSVRPNLKDLAHPGIARAREVVCGEQVG